jgi:hypothetical protein
LPGFLAEYRGQSASHNFYKPAASLLIFPSEKNGDSKLGAGC